MRKRNFEWKYKRVITIITLSLLVLTTEFIATKNARANAPFTSHTIANGFTEGWSVYAADVDGDGDMDVLGASYTDNDITWWENDGTPLDGLWPEHIIDDNFLCAGSVYAADLDGDGDMDVLGGSANYEVLNWWENDGSENFTPHTIAGSFTGASSVYAIDVDSDGDIDILDAALGGARVVWWENDGHASFTRHRIDYFAASSVYAADVNGDGHIDILGTDLLNNLVTWWENDGNQHFTRHNIDTNFNRARSVYTTDLDNDGDIDLLGAAEGDDTIAWWKNDGNENFTNNKYIISANLDSVQDVYAVDLDGDQDVDVVSAARNSVNGITWWENDGTENFSQHSLISPSPDLWAVYATDIDSDGDVDILDVGDSNQVTWWENTKAAIKGQVVTIDLTPIPNVLISAQQGNTLVRTDTTDGNGNYRLHSISPDLYSLSASLPGYSFAPSNPTVEIISTDVTQNFIGTQTGTSTPTPTPTATATPTPTPTSTPTPPPDPITTSGFKGANWLDLDLTNPNNNYGARNIGWNLELSPHIYDEAGDPTGAQINDLYSEDVQTIVRLHVGPPIRNPGADFLTIPCDDFNNWMIGTVDDHYTRVINTIGETSGSVPVFILDNEPNLDWGYTAEQYAHVFNCYYQHWREEGREQWLFVAGPGDANGAFVQFYQDLLNTGAETIAATDGFALHAYGYCQDCNRHTEVEESDYAVRDEVWESRFSDQWIAGWNNAIANRPDLRNRPVIITEYNSGAEDQPTDATLVNTIRRDPETQQELWQDWFDKTYCWARRINTLRGLLYFVDEGAPGRNATTTDDWYPVSLESNPTARAAWLVAPSAGQTCQDILGAAEPIGGNSLPTVGSIGGVISGTLGVQGFNNVFYVTDNLLVPVGQTLTVTMGTTLVFSPGLYLDVAGQLIAEGNNVFPVRFISPHDAGWAGLHFQPTAQGSRCLGCSLENLETGAVALTIEAPIALQYGLIRDVPNGTAISSTVPFTLTNLVIDYVGTGLRLAGSGAAPYTVSHLSLGRCQQGIVNQGQSVTLENSILTTCEAAVSTELAGTTSISYTLLYSNEQNFVTASDSQLNQGPGLLMADPLFVDFPDNYQLQPDSPAVDAANPLADYSQELGYNGGRADLGAYGNTWQAPQRPPLTQMAVTLNAATVQQVGQPGETVTYTLTLKNNGGVTDSYTVWTEDSHTHFDSRLFENGYASPRQIQLAPQEEISITVWVDIPLLPTLGLSSTIPVRAFNGYGVAAEINLTTSVVAFQEVGGQVVVEVEHFAGQTERSNRSWLTQTVLAGYVGAGYLNAVPDTDLQFTTSYTTTSPELQYTINFTNTGVYTVWLRGYAPNGAGDSIYVGLDGQPATGLTGFAPQTWGWATKRTNEPGGVVTVTVTEMGLHILRIWQREDGLRLDRIVLTTAGGYNPGGNGPPESELK